MHAEHADGAVRLQDRRLRIRYRRTRIASIESQAAPWLSPHPRVLRASPCCICAEILAWRCRRPMLAHHCQARVAAHASGATTWHKRVYGTRFGCGQRLRYVYRVNLWLKILSVPLRRALRPQLRFCGRRGQQDGAGARDDGPRLRRLKACSGGSHSHDAR